MPVSTKIADLPVQTVVARLADPKQHSGGGAAAAVNLATAAGCAELVLSLSVRRKANAARRDEIQALLDQAGELRDRFLAAADKDDEVLTALLGAQKAIRAATTDEARAEAEQGYQAALRAAAQVPLDLATDGLTFLRLLHGALPFATRFTVPDLGGAATMAHGAIDAVLLMADVNLALLADDPEAVAPRSAVAHIRQEAPAVANDVLHWTRAMIAGALPEETQRGQVA